tara:strand:+ start:99 stop:737 length:639 start_codon:yes stop_codon:yes gene_type:complete
MINFKYQDFIPNIVFVLIFSFMGSILHIRILSCHIQQLLHLKLYMLLALFIIVFMGVYSHKQIIKQGEIDEFKDIKIKANKMAFFGKLIILSLFYFILILMVFKVPKLTFIITSLIFIINISLSFVEFNNNTYPEFNTQLGNVNFYISVALYVLIIFGHIYYIGLERIELGDKFNLFKLYTSIGSCHYGDKTLSKKIFQVFLTGLGFNKFLK